jgi:hypothetical protein
MIGSRVIALERSEEPIEGYPMLLLHSSALLICRAQQEYASGSAIPVAGD